METENSLLDSIFDSTIKVSEKAISNKVKEPDIFCLRYIHKVKKAKKCTREAYRLASKLGIYSWGKEQLYKDIISAISSEEYESKTIEISSCLVFPIHGYFEFEDGDRLDVELLSLRDCRIIKGTQISKDIYLRIKETSNLGDTFVNVDDNKYIAIEEISLRLQELTNSLAGYEDSQYISYWYCDTDINILDYIADRFKAAKKVAKS